MARTFGVTLFFACLFLPCISQLDAKVLDITTYGAKADGSSDISKALLKAWAEACAEPYATKIVIPAGTYFLKEAAMRGPCKAPIQIRVDGTILAPADNNAITKDMEWITFETLNNLTISGSGTFDGQGKHSWGQNDCNKPGAIRMCNKLAKNFAFNFVNNSLVTGITSANSKLFHIMVFGCKNLTFSNMKITAPGFSPNTDGIHLGHTSDIKILETDIATGDDCISIGDGVCNVNITKVRCGPGHGISVGSLGRYQNELPVQGIYVNNCTLSGTLNGVRVKSWPALNAGDASEMHFENIIMDNVFNPILIDQMYCPNNQCKTNSPSKVKISKVSFKGIKGTSQSPTVVNLVCSSSYPCQGVEIGDINLAFTGLFGTITTNCTNVTPTFSGTQIPPICSHHSS